MTMPPELGIDPAVLQERSKDVGNFFTDEFRGSLSRSTDPAALLAGLSEMKTGGETPVARNSPDALETKKWWFGLKKQTDGLGDCSCCVSRRDSETDPQKNGH